MLGQVQTVGSKTVAWSKFCNEDPQFWNDLWPSVTWCFLLGECELIFTFVCKKRNIALIMLSTIIKKSSPRWQGTLNLCTPGLCNLYWACSKCRGNKNGIENYGNKISRKATSWKTKEEMGKLIIRNWIMRMESPVLFHYFRIRCSDILLVLLCEGSIQCSSLNVKGHDWKLLISCRIQCFQLWFVSQYVALTMWY